MPVTTDTILSVFATAGLRSTRPRRIIADLLARHARAGADFTIEELWKELKQVDPKLGRATLFRAVDVLVHLGLLDRVDLGNGSHRYRVCSGSHHHHLICTECHRIVETDLCLPATQLAAVGDKADFDIVWHSLELFGRCSACRTA